MNRARRKRPCVAAWKKGAKGKQRRPRSARAFAKSDYSLSNPLTKLMHFENVMMKTEDWDQIVRTRKLIRSFTAWTDRIYSSNLDRQAIADRIDPHQTPQNAESDKGLYTLCPLPVVCDIHQQVGKWTCLNFRANIDRSSSVRIHVLIVNALALVRFVVSSYASNSTCARTQSPASASGQQRLATSNYIHLPENAQMPRLIKRVSPREKGS